MSTEVKTAEAAAKDEVWSGYRFVILSDAKSTNGLKVIDLGAGHASANETWSGHILAALKTEALLNESIGAGYIDRHWPPAFKDSGAWPLGSLRQSFLNGTLTRLLDPNRVLRARIAEFVATGEFGLASGAGTHRRNSVGSGSARTSTRSRSLSRPMSTSSPKPSRPSSHPRRSYLRSSLSQRRRKLRCVRRNPTGQSKHGPRTAPL